MIPNSLFYCKNKDTYPPFKNGLYKEEYFVKKYLELTPKTKRKYIPVLWTNFQIESWFTRNKINMQNSLDEWLKNNPCEYGYFTVVQYDDACLLKLPENTIVYGSCSGSIPIPLIYQDINNTLENIPKKNFNDKDVLCSFVGNITSNNIQPNVRTLMFDVLSNKNNFKLVNSGGWTPNVDTNKQNIFINTTLNSKFALAPRGYGRSSFRFFEILKLGTIPIYVWNDKDWLPFKDEIDYGKLCINIHYSQLNNLENILLNVSENDYNNMLKYYDTISHLFTLEGLYDKIIKLET
jgi:hypothetical protein